VVVPTKHKTLLLSIALFTNTTADSVGMSGDIVALRGTNEASGVCSGVTLPEPRIKRKLHACEPHLVSRLRASTQHKYFHSPAP
jgi:hypothetical protein